MPLLNSEIGAAMQTLTHQVEQAFFSVEVKAAP
jgi:hypothetical protein